MDSNSHQQQKSAAEYFILDCEKYDDYLDTFVGSSDLRFIRNIRFCRKLVELGYRSTAVYSPKRFETQKDLVKELLMPVKRQNVLFGAHLNSIDPLLIELAAREKPNYHKIISTIIFLTHRNKNGFEVSGFIDFEASLSHCNLKLPGCTDWKGVFEEKCELRPRPDDLSFYNIHKGTVRHTNSDNYIVLHDVKHGLTFMHRGDHKKIFVDNKESSSKHNYLRSVVFSPKYGHVVLYDHIVRKKI